jgi:hypothetical protein
VTAETPVVLGAVRTQRGPEPRSVLRPQDNGPPGRLENQSGVDLDPRLRDASPRPRTHEGERPGRWQRPHPILDVPGRAAAAPTVLVQHRGIWRLALRVVGRAVEIGGLATVGELHPEAQELIRQRVCVDDGAKQVRELLVLSDRDGAQAQAEGEVEPGG